jgi:hypothetical protein
MPKIIWINENRIGKSIHKRSNFQSLQEEIKKKLMLKPYSSNDDDLYNEEEANFVTKLK